MRLRTMRSAATCYQAPLSKAVTLFETLIFTSLLRPSETPDSIVPSCDGSRKHVRDALAS
jgi:hypothetical protein